MIYSVGAAGKETEVWRGPGRLQEEEAAVVVVEEVRPVFCGKASVRSFLSWNALPSEAAEVGRPAAMLTGLCFPSGRSRPAAAPLPAGEQGAACRTPRWPLPTGSCRSRRWSPTCPGVWTLAAPWTPPPWGASCCYCYYCLWPTAEVGRPAAMPAGLCFRNRRSRPAAVSLPEEPRGAAHRASPPALCRSPPPSWQ